MVRPVPFELKRISTYVSIQRKDFKWIKENKLVASEIFDKGLEIVKEADYLLMDFIKKSNLYRKLWQSFAVLLPIRTVGVMGDKRTYENVIAIRAITSVDGMTADWARLPHNILAEISFSIINEVKGVNRVVYDISTKPPSTIEWE